MDGGKEEVKCTSTLTLRDKMKTEQDADQWLKTYEAETNTKWIVHKTFKCPNRYN